MSAGAKKNRRAYTSGQQQLPLGVDSPRPDLRVFQTDSLEFDGGLRNALTEAIKESGRSRAQIAATMTDLMYGDAGAAEVTKAQLDSWTAPSREGWRFPLSHLPAFIQATGAVWLLDLIAERCGCTIVREDQAALLELGRLTAERDRLDARERELVARLPKDLARDLQRRGRRP